jgi:phosphate transport system substrate-binding protein
MSHKQRKVFPSFAKAGRAVLAVSALALGTLVAGGFLAQSAAAESLRLGGSGAAIPAMKMMGEALKRQAPEFSLVIVPDLGSGGGLKALSLDKIEVAISGRSLTQEEEAQGMVAMEYGRSPFVLATPKKNVKGLTLKEIADIYAGRTTKWPDGTPIRLVIRPVNDVDTPLLASFSPAVKEGVELSQKRPGLVTAIYDLEVVNEIQKLEGGLGTSSLTPILAENHPLYPLAIDGVAPTPKNLADGKYKHYKPFYIVTRGRASAPVKRFIEFVHSAEGRKILADTGHQVIDAARPGVTASR